MWTISDNILSMKPLYVLAYNDIDTTKLPDTM